MLHGEIKVNDIPVGEWQATCVKNYNEFRDYDCFLTFRDLQGYPLEARWVLRGHEHHNGAVSLAARVLHEGMVKARRKTVE